MAPCCSSSTNHHLARIGSPNRIDYSNPDSELIEPLSTAGEVGSQRYLNLLKMRLSGSYDLLPPISLGQSACALYARSQVVAGQYIFSKSLTYEKMELNEHVLVRVLDYATTEDVTSFVSDLKGAIGGLVIPSYEHMSTALTGVLVVERGLPADAARRVSQSGFTHHFWFGLRGWCFLRLLCVDLSSGRVWANRRGKEVLKAYSPNLEPTPNSAVNVAG